jgi:hypothetical protein
MKYIRTKDAIYQDLGTDNLGWRMILCGKHSQTLDPKEKIIHKANAIEDLCDCFVEVGLGNPMIVSWEYVLHDDDRRNYDVYGAIFTNEGIKYVAKLNEEGELELL